ncbi:MAG: hypothetical protein ACRD2H_05555 [Terriglobales bacterium]
MLTASNQVGIVFAASTGNDCGNAGWPAAYHLSDEIAVAASDQNDYPSHWGSGQCTDTGGDVAAPGSNIWTTQRGVGGQEACGYSYDTTYDTAATIAQGLVGDCLSSPYFTPTYEGGGTVLLTTKAKGPYTNYSAAAQVVDRCYSGCGSPPVVDLSSQFTGGQS